ncbi:MAG: hypothetical protein R3D71_01370 [Rickettsiales bacterium]
MSEEKPTSNVVAVNFTDRIRNRVNTQIHAKPYTSSSHVTNLRAYMTMIVSNQDPLTKEIEKLKNKILVLDNLFSQKYGKTHCDSTNKLRKTIGCLSGTASSLSIVVSENFKYITNNNANKIKRLVGDSIKVIEETTGKLEIGYLPNIDITSKEISRLWEKLNETANNINRLGSSIWR